MAFITIFTPTYNRRKLLERVYVNLKRQTDYDFLWMIIDDGSTDNTSEYVNQIQKEENNFNIEYYYKENGGLHTGYTEAIKHLSTEMCMCCDSDDWLPYDCVEKIKRIWLSQKSDNCAGIVGLDALSDGTIIGKSLPECSCIDMNELLVKGLLVGDKKLVVRCELYKSLPPMRSIRGEKNFNPNYLNVQISERYKWIPTNEVLCYVEYQPDGMTNSMLKQYANSPNSFIEIRKLYIGLKKADLKFKCRHIVHYDAECLLAGRIGDIFTSSSPSRALSVGLFPLGLLFFLYIKLKA